MPNGEDLNEEMEFEERLKAKSLDDRTVFIGKQIYNLTNKFDSLNVKFDTFNGGGPSRKTVATTSGITTAVLIGIFEGLKAIFGRS